MSKYMVDSSDLTSVADAIRSKAGMDTPLEFPNEFASVVNNLSVIEDYDSEFVFKLTASTLTVNIYLTQSSPNAVTVNWGDGSEPEQSSDLLANFSHTYASAETYGVKVSCADGETWSPGGTFNSKMHSLIGDVSGSTSYSTLISAVFGKGANLSNQRCMAFCNRMVWVKLSKYVTDIGVDAFINCGYLDGLYIDDINVYLSINFGNRNGAPLYAAAHYLYLNDELVTDVTYPATITDIKNNCFAGCYSLRNLTILGQVTYIGASSFSGCKNLTDFVIPNTVTTIGSGAFTGCTSLTNLVIPDSVTRIDSYAFNSCSNVTNLTISNSLTTIDNAVFSGLSKLTTLTVPASITYIGASSFDRCTGLTSITFLSNRLSFGTSALANCTSLMSITCYATTPPTILYNSLNNVPANCNIYVPTQSVEAYKQAQYWSDRADYIQAIPQE